MWDTANIGQAKDIDYCPVLVPLGILFTKEAVLSLCLYGSRHESGTRPTNNPSLPEIVLLSQLSMSCMFDSTVFIYY